MFSSRIRWGLGKNALWRELEAKRSAGETIWDLTASNPTRVGISYPDDEILASLAVPEALVYTPDPKGTSGAREAPSYYSGHDIDVSKDALVLTASTSEAYGFLFKLLCDPGERVLVPRPSYPLFDFLTSLEGVMAVPYTLTFDGAWLIDFDELHAIGRDARVLVAVHPNNPTGSYLSGADRKRLLDLSESRSLALIVDEVFLDYPFSGAPRSFADADRGLVFVLSGLSKLAGLPQMKLAWIAVAGALEKRREALARLEHIADTYLSVGTAVQLAAPRLLELAPDLRRAIRSRTASNLEMLSREARAVPSISVLPVDGGWYQPLVPALATSRCRELRGLGARRLEASLRISSSGTFLRLFARGPRRRELAHGAYGAQGGARQASPQRGRSCRLSRLSPWSLTRRQVSMAPGHRPHVGEHVHAHGFETRHERLARAERPYSIGNVAKTRRLSSPRLRLSS